MPVVASVTTVLSCAVPAVDDSVKLESPMRNELLVVIKTFAYWRPLELWRHR